MTDPIGLIGVSASQPGLLRHAARVVGDGPSFAQVLMEKIAQVDRMQKDADLAVAQVAAGRGADVSRVLLAKQKADEAFGVLLQVHETLQNAYEEIKQLRV